MGLPVIVEEHETKDQQRKRLAIELRAIAAQWNSKLIEVLDLGVEVQVHMLTDTVVDRDGLVEHVDISYQTPPKHY